MAPSTTPFQSVPAKNHEANSIKKNRFFHAIDNQSNNVTVKDVYEQENVMHGTGKKWLRQQKRLRDVALRRISKKRSGQSKKVSSGLMNQMLDPHENPVQNQLWPIQIEDFYLDILSRTLRAVFNQHIPWHYVSSRPKFIRSVKKIKTFRCNID